MKHSQAYNPGIQTEILLSALRCKAEEMAHNLKNQAYDESRQSVDSFFSKERMDKELEEIRCLLREAIARNEIASTIHVEANAMNFFCILIHPWSGKTSEQLEALYQLIRR